MKKSSGRKERRRLIRANNRKNGANIKHRQKVAKARRLYVKKKAKAKLARKQRKAA